jgi:Holliday junction DNA helicase RuvA
MITRLTGRLASLQPDAATIAAGPYEHEVYIPEFVRRQLQNSVGREVSLLTIEYLEGNAARGNMIPRMIGFASAAEREFFELICSVDGVGVKKALRAMVRPVRDVAVAIEEQDVRQLSALPGIGGALAERIIAKLRRRMAKFALMVAHELPPESAAERNVVNEAFEALVALGHTPADARARIEVVSRAGGRFNSVEDVLEQIYRAGQR